MDLRKKRLMVDMPDGTSWSIPVQVIAEHRARLYSNRIDPERGYRETLEWTLELFGEDDFEITDWAANNMDWDDVEKHATKIEKQNEPPPNYVSGWYEAEKTVIET